MIGKPEIIRVAGQLSLNPHVVEKDYALGWLLVVSTVLSMADRQDDGICSLESTGQVLFHFHVGQFFLVAEESCKTVPL